jgi:hypothetical protein
MPERITKGLADFLRSTTALSDSTREEARFNLRSLVRDHVYQDRIPQGKSPDFIAGDVALVISISSAFPHYATDKEVAITTRFIDVDVYAGTAAKVDEAWGYLHQLLTSYRGAMGDYTVGKCLMQTVLSLPTSPADASDGWHFVYSSSWEIGYDQTVPVA